MTKGLVTSRIRTSTSGKNPANYLSFYLSERIKPYEADITGLAIFSFALAFLFVYRIVYLLSGA